MLNLRENYCDIMIYRKKYRFGLPVSVTELLWNFLSRKVLKAPIVMLMRLLSELAYVI